MQELKRRQTVGAKNEKGESKRMREREREGEGERRERDSRKRIISVFRSGHPFGGGGVRVMGVFLRLPNTD